jgi:hypothetical protein
MSVMFVCVCVCSCVCERESVCVSVFNVYLKRETQTVISM